MDCELASVFGEGVGDALSVEVDVRQFAVGVDGADKICAEAADGIADGAVGHDDVLLQVTDGGAQEV